MAAISWRTRADYPHADDPRYGYVGPQLRFLLVSVAERWYATDRVEPELFGGTYDECTQWCFLRLPTTPHGVAGEHCRGSGV